MKSLFISTRNTRRLPIDLGKEILRSDVPYNISDDEVKWLIEHDILLCIDLRMPKEYTRKPCDKLCEYPFIYMNIPLAKDVIPNTPKEVPGNYRSMVNERLKKVIQIIEESEHGVIFFCHAGKDRTGVVSAKLLQKHNVSEEIIIDDYMQSKENLQDLFNEFLSLHPEVDRKVITPSEEYIKAVL